MKMGVIAKIRYTYPKARYMDKFYNTKAMVADLKLNSDDYENSQKHVSLLEKDWIGKRVVNDFSTRQEKCLTNTGASLLSTAKVTQRASAVYLQTLISNVFGDSAYYSVYTSFGRGSTTEMLDFKMTPDTKLLMRELFNSYGNEKFSMAIKVSSTSNSYYNTNYGIALASVGSPDGVKGDSRIQVIEYTDTAINVDDAAKYMSKTAIKALTDGLSL